MRVKIISFTTFAAGSHGDHGDMFSKLEALINEWIEGNPGIKIEDIKMSNFGTNYGEHRATYFGIAMIMYLPAKDRNTK